jgi:hypothetical protein
VSDDRKYVRVYYSIIDDERFEHVYSDDAALAAWLRMLLDADALWPASASLPRSLPRRVLRVLTDSGLIEVSGHRFRIHGLDRERQRRSDAGRVGGLASGRSRAIGTVEEPPFNGAPNDRSTVGERKSNLAEQRQDKTSRDAQDARARAEPTWFDREAPEGPALAWLATHGAALAPNGGGLHVKLARLVEVHGAAKVVATFEAIAPDCTEARQFVLGADNRLNRIPVAPANGKPETPQERQLRELTERQEARESAKEEARLRAKGATT